MSPFHRVHPLCISILLLVGALVCCARVNFENKQSASPFIRGQMDQTHFYEDIESELSSRGQETTPQIFLARN